MRASDIGIVSPVDASIVTSGAAGGTIARIKGADIPFIGRASAICGGSRTMMEENPDLPRRVDMVIE